MITKELFVRIMGEMTQERERIEKFNDALGLVCDGYPVVELGNGYLNALIDTLNAYFNEENEEYPTIEWWLYENVEKKIKVKTKEEELELDVTNAEDLYDFLMAKKEWKKEKKDENE